jgi:hypothetical protein
MTWHLVLAGIGLVIFWIIAAGIAALTWVCFRVLQNNLRVSENRLAAKIELLSGQMRELSSRPDPRSSS